MWGNMNQERINQTLKQHKQLLAKYAITKDDKLIVGIVRTGEELSLVIAGFQCQKCKTDRKLQYHHLIMRPAARYINDKTRYLSQRHYWANIIILCERCHDQYHDVGIIERDEKAFISKEKIAKIKKEYGG